jgi:putative membrane protein
MTSLATLPNFLLYFAASVVLFAGFLVVYTRLVRLHEWRLIREGNNAVALTLAGAMLGFAMPLAVAIARSANLIDMAVWAAVSLVLQLLCFAALRLLRRDAGAALARGDMAEAILMAAGSTVLGLLNAACLT